MWQRAEAVLVTLLKGAVRAYQLLLSPVLPGGCRFYPSCSHYAMDALNAHGLLIGTWMATKRVLRCNPWHPGGVDPVPEAADRRAHAACQHTPKLASGGSAGR